MSGYLFNLVQYAFFWCFFGFLIFNPAFANVVMTGTRVVFPADAKEKTLQFSNKSEIPYLMQVWLDKGNDQSTPENADAPFLPNPQVFRINPHQGQMVRLVNLPTESLPEDRESIFYLNFKQTPALKKSLEDENKLVLVVKSRLKVFYRPKTLPDKVDDIPLKLKFKLLNDDKGSWLQIENSSSYYVNLIQAEVKTDAHVVKTKSTLMLEPKSNSKWILDNKIKSNQKAVVTVKMVNDYGAISKYDITSQIFH
ncbi:molecular chaperone [Acinetobacter sp. C26M]|uniref:fimbrial biogenesis chaperone n=1 Tax=unclassified Acinetobacter TaxID=196816 RepID=UPI002036E5D5|nr:MULTISPECIES: molecular chaperone [unclassified Acinetobacter]USA47466.1 molecular chaperone [Acinetobacter sp. C26M]USA50947.1 molecular chaperone [Acinetobacter sp. C26G]